MAFSYYQIEDYLPNSLFGFAQAEQLRQSLRYIAEDVLGNPAANSNNVNIAGGANFGFDLKGAREHLVFWQGTASADAYVGFGTLSSTRHGYAMTRAGSVVALHATGLCFSFTSSQTATWQIQKNGTNLVASSSQTWTALNQIKDYSNTYARGANTFVAGDELELLWDWSSGTAGVYQMVILEICVDT